MIARSGQLNHVIFAIHHFHFEYPGVEIQGCTDVFHRYGKMSESERFCH